MNGAAALMYGEAQRIDKAVLSSGTGICAAKGAKQPPTTCSYFLGLRWLEDNKK